MAKIELGTKRQCQECGSKFYDLGRDPIICPKCGAVFQVAALKSRAGTARKEDEDDEHESESAEPAAELVPLEEADAPDDAAVVTDDAEIEEDIAGDDDDGTFLETDEEDGDDVSDLIDGDIDEDDES